MSSSFWLLAPESRDLSQAEKEIIACKTEEIHKMATIFTQSNNQRPSSVKKLSHCEFTQLRKLLVLSQVEINHVTQEPKVKH